MTKTPEEMAAEWYWANLTEQAPIVMLTNPVKHPPCPRKAFLAGYEAGHHAGFESCLKIQEAATEHLEKQMINEMYVRMEPLLKEKI